MQKTSKKKKTFQKLWQVFFVYIFCKLPFKFYVNNNS